MYQIFVLTIYYLIILSNFNLAKFPFLPLQFPFSLSAFVKSLKVVWRWLLYLSGRFNLTALRKKTFLFRKTHSFLCNNKQRVSGRKKSMQIVPTYKKKEKSEIRESKEQRKQMLSCGASFSDFFFDNGTKC